MLHYRDCFKTGNYFWEKTSVCLFTGLPQKPYPNFTKFSLCYLWLWLGLTLMTMQYTVYLTVLWTSCFHIIGHTRCMARLTAEGCETVGGRAEELNFNASDPPLCIASHLLASLGRKPSYTQHSLAVDVNNVLHTGQSLLSYSALFRSANHCFVNNCTKLALTTIIFLFVCNIV